ncbi:MAG TPA: DUF4142 domain-containing protein [Cytophagaceae bacterium]|jgi:putative membrane protein|nr:DUF4142 domain-containing protein [Cytophagaceae bacterium]
MKTTNNSIFQNLLSKPVIFKTVIFSAILLGSVACSNNQKPQDTKEMAEDKNEAKFNDTKEKDAEFLVKVAEINLEEIQLGQLAQESATTADAKDLGKMMEQAHKQGQEKLIALATTKSITVPMSPTDKGKDAYKELTSKTGKDFDKKYCEMMVDGHKKAIEMVEKASKDANDADIRAFATNLLPELNMHLEHAQQCKDKVDKM